MGKNNAPKERGNVLVIVGLAIGGIILVSGLAFALLHLRSTNEATSLSPKAAEPTVVFRLPTVAVSSDSGKLKDLIGGGTIVTPSLSPSLVSTPAGSLVQPTMVAILATDKKSLTVTFDHLTNVRRVTYSVTYPTSTGDKGANGSFNVENTSPVSRDVKLGTCSSGGTCTYDTVTGSITMRGVFTPIFGVAAELTQTVPY